MDVTLLLYFTSAIVGVLSTARLTRLVVEDTWPPSMWFRDKWMTWTKDGPWAEFITCEWCVAPWLVAANLAGAVLTDFHPVWWVVNVWLAASLATSWVAIKAGE